MIAVKTGPIVTSRVGAWQPLRLPPQRLELHAARNIKYDLQFDQYPPTKNAHRPTVQESYNKTEKARKDARRND